MVVPLGDDDGVGGCVHVHGDDSGGANCGVEREDNFLDDVVVVADVAAPDDDDAAAVEFGSHVVVAAADDANVVAVVEV